MVAEKNDHRRPEGDKVTHLEGWRKLKEEQGTGEGSLPELLQHMRQVRDSVPVNNMLREELRKELARRKSGAELSGAELSGEDKAFPGEPPEFVTGPPRRPNKWLLAGLAGVFLLFVCLFSVLSGSGKKALEPGDTRLLSRFRAEEAALAPTFNPAGTVAVLSRSGALLLLDGEGGQFGLVNPPAGEKLMYPSWSPDGSQLALVRRKDGGVQEIVVINIPLNYQNEKLGGIIRESLLKPDVEVMHREKAGVEYTHLAWSPDGKAMAYSIKQPGAGSEVYILEKENITNIGPGRHPTWAPDGSGLVVERDQAPVTGAQPGDPGQVKTTATLWLVDRHSGKALLLGEGGLPAWGRNGHLAYVDLKIRERVLSYLPDGSPQFSVQQLAETVRTVYLGNSGQDALAKAKSKDSPLAGSHMLITAEDPPGPAELEWMRRMELSGVREPRTLLLGRASTSFESLGFGQDGKWFVTCRRDGDTVAMSRVAAEERPVKGGR